MKSRILSILYTFAILAMAASAAAQQAQTQRAPIYPVNAKYVQGFGPGYWPTVNSGLVLELGAGTANCAGTIETYAGGTLTMTASTTNYVYLDTASSCAPAVKTTTFTSSDIPLAIVVTGSSTITSIADDRTMFVQPGTVATSTTATNLAGGATGSAPYQSASATTAYLASPTTSGHYFVYAWAPSGSAVDPEVLDLATWYGLQTISATQINGVPFCSGFSPTNGEVIEYTTGGSPNPCYGAFTAGSAYYQTVQANGSSATQEPKLNLLSGTNATVSCADNSGASSTDCTVSATGGGGLGGDYIETGNLLITSADNGKKFHMACLVACTVTLPTSVPANGFTVFITNEGLLPDSLVPTTGASLLYANNAPLGTGTFNSGTNFMVSSDGANYHVAGAFMTGSNVIPLIVQTSPLAGGTGCGGYPCNIIFTGNVNPGNAIDITYQHSNGYGPSNSVPYDDNEDTFNLVNSGNPSADDSWEYVACNVKGGVGSSTIKAANYWIIEVAYEISAKQASDCVGGNKSAVSVSASSLSTGSISTTVPNELILVTGQQRTTSTLVTLTEANGYTTLYNPGLVASALNYQSWNGIDAGTGSLSDTVSTSLTGSIYVSITAFKPQTTSTAFTQGDLLVAGVNGQTVPLHPTSTAGYALTNNGTGIAPSYKPGFSVNGTFVPQPNFNSTTPATGTNGINDIVQASGSNVSAYTPPATSSTPGVIQPDNSTCTVSSGTLTCTGSGGGAFDNGVGPGYQDVTEIAAPGNPGSGNDRLYTDSTSHVLTCLTSGGANCMPAASGTWNTLSFNSIPLTNFPGCGSNDAFQSTAAISLSYGNTLNVQASFNYSTGGSIAFATAATGVGGYVLAAQYDKNLVTYKFNSSGVLTSISAASGTSHTFSVATTPLKFSLYAGSSSFNYLSGWAMNNSNNGSWGGIPVSNTDTTYNMGGGSVYVFLCPGGTGLTLSSIFSASYMVSPTPW